jgi:cytoskeletal protein CcmA (bactofilin family)
VNINLGGMFGQQSDPKNPRIMGAGNLPGGKFESLTIQGAGKVTGSVEARSVSLSGASTIEGDVKARTFEAKGSSTVQGRIVADEITTGGALKAGGGIKAGKFEAKGAFSAGGDVEAKTFRASGGFGVEGRIKADEIDIELNGRCHAKSLEGAEISVKRGSSAGSGAAVSVSVSGHGAVSVVTGSDGNLEVDSVEGDEVALEATKAKLVKGKRVSIGAGCEIERVKYTEELKVDEDAKVEKQERVSK